MANNTLNKKVLLVDDDRNILSSFERNLSRHYTVHTALCAKEAVLIFQKEGPFAVVVSDLRMPEINGIKLLTALADLASDTVRIMLTGYADVESATAAVNKGRVFRFLTKPVDIRELRAAIDAGIEQYRLVQMEKVFLKQTLKGCVQVLTDIMSMTNSEAFARGERVKQSICRMSSYTDIPNFERTELAAMLSQLGCVAIPDDILKRKYAGQDLSAEEEQIVSMNALIGSSLLANIPYLEDIAEIIEFQDDPDSQKAPVEARLLALALEYDTLITSGLEKLEALQVLKIHWKHEQQLFEAFEKGVYRDSGYVVHAITIGEMKARMILDEDLVTTTGVPLLIKGQELTYQHVERLLAVRQSGVIKEPIRVRVPLETTSSCSTSEEILSDQQ